ncbi:Ty3/gypsy retrotransposon protein [Senna tora]|uniref:Ty3/gypsy retrotransposon protein n=1 Tax=Senna tora TaxID=362788 RepID=A0A834X661_9FABA|nr:Ty3/gypsy retrotransposon protein [Senna tora]
MLPDQKQPVMDGKAQVQQASPNDEGPSESLMRRSVRMKKPTWKCIGQYAFEGARESVKLDFPRFNGFEPLHWLFKVERFFAYYETPDDQRVTIAAVHFEGVVVPWFQMMSKSSRVDSWVALSKAIEVEFGPSQFESPRALLFKLFQKTTVADFYREFMILATRVEGISDEALLDCFISGLKPAICRDVIAQAPSSLLRAAALARIFYERSSMGFSQSSSRNHFNPSTSLVLVPSPQVPVPLSTSTSLVPVLAATTASSSSAFGKSSLPPLLPTPNVPPLQTVKRMSAAEMQLRREKKLCFTCDAPYSWSHRCPNKHYMILQIEDEEEGVDVQVLLDGGSSDNFIQPRVVRTLKLAVEPMTPFKVLVGNGHVLTGFSMPQYVDTGASRASIPDDLPTDLKQLLQNFSMVFDVPHGLPPQHSHDHRILLQDDKPSRIEYLGHFVSAKGVEMDPAKIQAIIEWPLPTTIKQLRGFLGLSGYYRRFIHRYSAIAAPLTSLLKKTDFHWSDEATIAFNALKTAVTSAPVLVLLDFSKPFTIETDASGLGIGAMSNRMQQRSAYVREMFAITEAVAKFRHYLIGHFFTIRTDQKSLRHLTDQTVQTPEQEEWLPKLLGFQFVIEYKPGKLNTVADALSRSCFVASSSPVFNILDDVRRALPQDVTTARLLSQCVDNTVVDPRYTLTDGVLYWKGRIVIPANASTLKHSILHEYHASPLGGHAGHLHTYTRLASTFYWPNMRREPYCQHSVHLRRNQKLGLRYFGPFPIVERIGEVAYRLQLPLHAKIHDVFHVSQLKRCVGSASDMNMPLPLLTTEYGPVISPKAILQRRDIQVGNQWETQLLVAWDDGSCPTWETLTDFQQSYPTFDLEDKVTFNGGGNVMLPDQKQPVMDGKAQVQQASPNDEGPSESLMRRSVRMKKPTWKCIG